MENIPVVDVSVIIPAFNVENFIGRALESVFSQTASPREIIVVDDGSTDQTAAVVKRFPAIRYIYQKNTGAAAARNSGIAEAAGRWIAFLDADDVWKDHHLAGLMAIVDKYSLVWACGSAGIVNFNQQSVVYKEENWLPTLKNGFFENFFQAYALNVPFYTCGMLINRDVITRFGGFNTTYPVGEDLDMWFRIAHEFPVVGLLRPPSVLYLRREGSLMKVYGDRAETFLRLLNDHWKISHDGGKSVYHRFEPAARKLAKLVLLKSLRHGNQALLRTLLSDYRQILGIFVVSCWLAVKFPGFIAIYNNVIKLGVGVKHSARKLSHYLKLNLLFKTRIS